MMKTNSNQYIWRRPVLEDARAITEMLNLCDIEAHGIPDTVLTDIIDMWSSIDVENNAWIVVTTQYQIVGYAFLDLRGSTRMDTCIFVHPSFKGLGVGTMLLEKVEERAHILAADREPGQQLNNQVPFTNKGAVELVESKGFTFSRLYKRMRIELTNRPQTDFPDGILIQTFQPDKDEEMLFTIYDETFRDTWSYYKADPQQWIQQQKGEHFDPNLWFIVYDHQTPIAFLMSKLHDDGLFIDYIGVKREARKQGIGHKLLIHAFQAAYDRGQNTVLLYVDSNSLTNAHYVYERAGMKPDIQTAIYRKEM